MLVVAWLMLLLLLKSAMLLLLLLPTLLTPLCGVATTVHAYLLWCACSNTTLHCGRCNAWPRRSTALQTERSMLCGGGGGGSTTHKQTKVIALFPSPLHIHMLGNQVLKRVRGWDWWPLMDNSEAIKQVLQRVEHLQVCWFVVCCVIHC